MNGPLGLMEVFLNRTMIEKPPWDRNVSFSFMYRRWNTRKNLLAYKNMTRPAVCSSLSLEWTSQKLTSVEKLRFLSLGIMSWYCTGRVLILGCNNARHPVERPVTPATRVLWLPICSLLAPRTISLVANIQFVSTCLRSCMFPYNQSIYSHVQRSFVPETEQPPQSK